MRVCELVAGGRVIVLERLERRDDSRPEYSVHFRSRPPKNIIFPGGPIRPRRPTRRARNNPDEYFGNARRNLSPHPRLAHRAPEPRVLQCRCRSGRYPALGPLIRLFYPLRNAPEYSRRGISDNARDTNAVPAFRA